MLDLEEDGTKVLRNIVSYLPKNREVHVTRWIYINTAAKFSYPVLGVQIFVV